MCVPGRGEWSRRFAVLGSRHHSGRKGPQEVTPAPVSQREERWQLDLLDQLSLWSAETGNQMTNTDPSNELSRQPPVLLPPRTLLPDLVPLHVQKDAITCWS